MVSSARPMRAGFLSGLSCEAALPPLDTQRSSRLMHASRETAPTVTVMVDRHSCSVRRIRLFSASLKVPGSVRLTPHEPSWWLLSEDFRSFGLRVEGVAAWSANSMTFHSWSTSRARCAFRSHVAFMRAPSSACSMRAFQTGRTGCFRSSRLSCREGSPARLPRCPRGTSSPNTRTRLRIRET